LPCWKWSPPIPVRYVRAPTRAAASRRADSVAQLGSRGNGSQWYGIGASNQSKSISPSPATSWERPAGAAASPTAISSRSARRLGWS
jgi:hypothetical protein